MRRARGALAVNLETQFSPTGRLAELMLAMGIAVAAVALGRLLLPGRGPGSRLEEIAVAGPLGLSLIVSVGPLIIPEGTSKLAIVAVGQIALALPLDHRRRLWESAAYQWDSLGHFQIIESIESRFGVELEHPEAVRLLSEDANASAAKSRTRPSANP